MLYHIICPVEKYGTSGGVAQVVERFVRDEEAASSSLVTPIIRKNLERSRFFFFHVNRMFAWRAFYYSCQ